MFKVHDRVGQYAILLYKFLKRRPNDSRIGLLRHAHQQNGGLR